MQKPETRRVKRTFAGFLSVLRYRVILGSGVFGWFVGIILLATGIYYYYQGPLGGALMFGSSFMVAFGLGFLFLGSAALYVCLTEYMRWMSRK